MSLLGLFMLFLHLVSGAQITSVQLFHHELEANTGSSLLIPCKFHVDEPIHGERIKLEWGITPARGGSYTPIVRLSGTERLLMNNTYRQTGPSFLAKLDNGTCSIFISPVDQDDSGTYEVHLAVDDVEYRPIPKIKIHIRNKSGEDESPSMTSATDHLKEDREPEGNGQKTMIKARGPNHERDENIDPEIMWYGTILQDLKNNGGLLYLEIAGGVISLVLILGSLTGCLFGIKYCKLRKNFKDAVKLMEEDRLYGRSITQIGRDELNPVEENENKRTTEAEGTEKSAEEPATAQVIEDELNPVEGGERKMTEAERTEESTEKLMMAMSVGATMSVPNATTVLHAPFKIFHRPATAQVIKGELNPVDGNENKKMTKAERTKNSAEELNMATSASATMSVPNATTVLHTPFKIFHPQPASNISSATAQVSKPELNPVEGNENKKMTKAERTEKSAEKLKMAMSASATMSEPSATSVLHTPFKISHPQPAISTSSAGNSSGLSLASKKNGSTKVSRSKQSIKVRSYNRYLKKFPSIGNISKKTHTD